MKTEKQFMVDEEKKVSVDAITRDQYSYKDAMKSFYEIWLYHILDRNEN